MEINATQVAQRAADPTGFRNAQFSASRRASNSVGHNPTSGIQRIVAKTMVQDPLESLSKVSIPCVIPVKINASAPAIVKWQKTHRALSRLLSCLLQQARSTAFLNCFACAWLTHGSKPASRQNIVRSAGFFPKPPSRSADTRGRVRLGPPIPQSCPSRAAALRFSTSSREKRALCEWFTVSGLATKFFFWPFR